MPIDDLEEYENIDNYLNQDDEGEVLEEDSFNPSLTYFEDFDNALSDIDFSEIRGKDFKKSFSKVNRKIENKKSVKFSKPSKQAQPKIVKQKAIKPLVKDFGVKKKATIEGGKKQLAKVFVPRDKKVIVEGVSKFILSNTPENDAVKRLGYYEGKKLNELIIIFNNNSLLNFNLELFNPSMPLDYLYSTSLNLNDKIQIAGGAVAYTDVLFNLLANPALIINAKFIVAGPTVTQQLTQTIQVVNKSTAGVEKVIPINIALQIDTMQVQNDMVVFDVNQTLGRPYIPDGMDIINYNVLAGNTVTMCFYYKQISLKKVLYKEARNNRIIM